MAACRGKGGRGKRGCKGATAASGCQVRGAERGGARGSRQLSQSRVPRRHLHEAAVQLAAGAGGLAGLLVADPSALLTKGPHADAVLREQRCKRARFVCACCLHPPAAAALGTVLRRALRASGAAKNPEGDPKPLFPVKFPAAPYLPVLHSDVGRGLVEDVIPPVEGELLGRVVTHLRGEKGTDGGTKRGQTGGPSKEGTATRTPSTPPGVSFGATTGAGPLPSPYSPPRCRTSPSP